MAIERTTTRPFADELPRLLAERGLSLRLVARDVGGFDHAYLSRMLAAKVKPNPEHVAHIAEYLGLADDYFPEVREARTIEAIRGSPTLRDEVYFGRVTPRRARRRR
jgi:transcriptional regulator with XRE-family HTH domain